ncbi:phage portal protein [Pedobacter cryoconitis]|uniref:HK97 family phage portal protein n=1 Tax=Pedobacter cryoconitis TaxID=188932 RepID=A0A327SJH5_9SPHI|nr:phage portal protein [Pedobacter cryoconitis]RAJ28878.1 HK97 family phage portal protein [Pedobacter cryoconitis]
MGWFNFKSKKTSVLKDASQSAVGHAVVDNELFKAFYKYMGAGAVNWFDQTGETYVDKGYSGNEHVFSVMRVYLNKAKIPNYILSKKKDKKAFTRFDQFIRSKDDSHRIEALRYKALALEELDSHPLLDLLENPNSYQTRTEFIEAAFGFYKLLGETFIYGIAPLSGRDAGRFTELHVLPAHLVVPVFSGNYLKPIRGYKFMMGDYSIEIPAENIMHMKTWNPHWDHNGTQLRGFSPLKPGTKTLTRNEANQTAQTKAYKNGGSAYLLSGDSSGNNEPLTQTQIDLINERIIENIRGEENFMNITATNGNVKATKIGESPVDLELLAGDVADRGKTASLFGVDPLLVGDKSGSSFNNQEQAYKALVTNVILPDQMEFTSKLSTWILPQYEDENLHLCFDTECYPELKPDYKLLMEIYGKPRLRENEKRGVFGWDDDPMPEMNEIYIEANLIPLSRIKELDINRSRSNQNEKPPLEPVIPVV